MEVECELDFIKHRCHLCELPRVIEVEVLRRHVEEQCLFAQFALACVTWVNARILKDTEVRDVFVTRDGFVRFATTERDLMRYTPFECLQMHG